jgi:hypothetical protein
MSVRLQDPNLPPNPASNVELADLVQLVRQGYAVHLVLEVNRAAPDGKCFILRDAFLAALHSAYADIAAVRAYLESVCPQVDTSIAIPRAANGALDTSTPAFRNARQELRLKTGYASLDCDRALRWADGDAERALARLIETDGYASSKV